MIRVRVSFLIYQIHCSFVYSLRRIFCRNNFLMFQKRTFLYALICCCCLGVANDEDGSKCDDAADEGDKSESDLNSPSTPVTQRTKKGPPNSPDQTAGQPAVIFKERWKVTPNSNPYEPNSYVWLRDIHNSQSYENCRNTTTFFLSSTILFYTLFVICKAIY